MNGPWVELAVTDGRGPSGLPDTVQMSCSLAGSSAATCPAELDFVLQEFYELEGLDTGGLGPVEAAIGSVIADAPASASTPSATSS